MTAGQQESSNILLALAGLCFLGLVVLLVWSFADLGSLFEGEEAPEPVTIAEATFEPATPDPDEAPDPVEAPEDIDPLEAAARELEARRLERGLDHQRAVDRLVQELEEADPDDLIRELGRQEAANSMGQRAPAEWMAQPQDFDPEEIEAVLDSYDAPTEEFYENLRQNSTIGAEVLTEALIPCVEPLRERSPRFDDTLGMRWTLAVEEGRGYVRDVHLVAGRGLDTDFSECLERHDLTGEFEPLGHDEVEITVHSNLTFDVP